MMKLMMQAMKQAMMMQAMKQAMMQLQHQPLEELVGMQRKVASWRERSPKKFVGERSRKESRAP
jgi:hypothetical protein